MSDALPHQRPDDFHLNKKGIPKEQLKRLIRDYEFKPGINMAGFIAHGALGRATTWTGGDYLEHCIRVSGIGISKPVRKLSNEEKIVGILHDVLEDSDWTVDDLREVGFSEKICNAVVSVTKLPPVEGQPKEKYLDASKRASIDPIGRRVKMRDNDDNMDLTRGPFAAGDKQKYLYHISHAYLEAVDDDEITPNSSIWAFLRDPRYAKLVNAENAHVIAGATSEPMPLDFMRKFNLAASAAAPFPA